MALREQVIDVPILSTQQGVPKTAGLAGSLLRLVDGQAVKFQALSAAISKLRVDKRDAFATLSDAVRDVVDGTVIPAAPLNQQTLLADHGGRLLLVSNDKTHVYSNTTAAWERHDYQLPTDSLTQKYVHTSNTLATTPDGAHALGVSCDVWVTEADHNAGGGTPAELAGCYFRIVDADGVVLRASTRTIDPTDRRIKVVSSGSDFWIFSEKGDGTGLVHVRVVDRYGVDLAADAFSVTYTSPGFWDVVSTSFGILFAQPAVGGVQFTKLTRTAGTIFTTTNTDVTIAGISRIGFLTNDVDGFAYLSSIDHVGTDDNDVHVYRITSGLVQDLDYSIVSAQPDEIANVTGYVVPGGSGDVVVAFSVIDDTAPPNTNPLANFVREYYAHNGGASIFTKTLRSMNIVSRAFAIRGRYYYVGYYPSKTVSVAFNEELANQPTYFLCPLNNAAQPVAGRFEYGQAYADWQTAGSIYNFSLASCVSVFPSGFRVPLSYRAESFTATRMQVNGDITIPVKTQATTVGVKAYSFGPDQGQPVAFDTDILLPGPIATTWSGGEFSESNVNLAFEQVSLTVGTASGAGLTVGSYQFIAVPEWTDDNGNRVRGIPSPPRTVDVLVGGKKITVGGHMLHATTKRDLLISIYRTDMLPDAGGGYITSTQHYKITADAPTSADAPLYNDPAADTWSFEDEHENITASEILYTDKGQLPNFPAPAFLRGCVWQQRVCLIGDDGAIWVSAPRTEGDAVWFHPAFRMVVPGDDEPVAIAATTESYLVVFCRKTMYYFPAVALPSSSGASGTLPEAVELKFNMGCTGLALATGMGTFFSSSSGSLWLLPRDLGAPQWIAQPLADVLDGTVSALGIDSKQRVYAVVGSTLGVYDTIAGCWYEWSTPNNVQLLATYQGVLAFGDGTLVWRQLPGNYVDSQFVNGVQTMLPYNMSVELNSLHFGAVRNFASLLEIQAIGETHTACTVTLSLAFDDNPDIVELTSWATDPTVPFEYSYGPANQLCSAVAMTLTESVGAGQAPGQGFSVELLSLTVGLHGGQNRLPDNRRV